MHILANHMIHMIPYEPSRCIRIVIFDTCGVHSAPNVAGGAMSLERRACAVGPASACAAAALTTAGLVVTHGTARAPFCTLLRESPGGASCTLAVQVLECARWADSAREFGTLLVARRAHRTVAGAGLAARLPDLTARARTAALTSALSLGILVFVAARSTFNTDVHHVYFALVPGRAYPTLAVVLVTVHLCLVLTGGACCVSLARAV